MVDVLFSYDSERARLARAHRYIKGTFSTVLLLFILLLLVSGIVLLLNNYSAGWFLFGLSSWPFMVYIWEKRYLSDLPSANGDSIDARIESDLLGRLPRKLTPKILANELGNVTSAQFIMARSGLSPGMLAQVLGDNQDEIALVWSAARDMQTSGVIRSSTLVAGLTKTNQNLLQLLPHLQLDEEDLPLLADWFIHLDELIKQYNKPRRTGGIARDWSFGYLNLLDRFGVNLSNRQAMYVNLEGHQEVIDYMMQVLSGGGRQNAALVGPLGSGKTAVLYAFAERLMQDDKTIPESLRFRQVISLNASSLISAVKGRSQLEDLLNRVLLEAYHAKNVILCLDDAELFFEEGVGSIDVTNILLPVIENSALRIILAMDEQRWLQISSRNPALAASLNRVAIKPASSLETMNVLQDQLINIEFQNKVTFMYQAVKESIRLSDRYFYDQAQPGKALHLLEQAVVYAEGGLITASSVQQAVEQTQGVKVSAVTDQSDRDRLLNLEEHIHERMVNQKRAVTVVSDALRRARAGVRNEKRPVGTFLFLGPTGTGKTELAKSLADAYFGGEDHLIRIDLNEFVRAEDVTRLIADGADDPMSLCAQVMKQPFSVILLDEIEKAHTSVLTSLLQVLDEGVLRDIKGREISFRDTVMIATSNAGSEQIRHHVEQGEDLEQFEHAFTNELVTTGQFRTEFLNRFDEIVLFKPLGKEELFQVIDRIIAGTNKTLEPQKITLALTDSAKEKLVDLGYDPQLGARPLRRVIQRNVESLLAKRLLAGEIQAGQTMTIDVGDIHK